MQAITPQEKDVVKAGLILAIVLFGAVVYYYFYIVMEQQKRDKEAIVVIEKDIRVLKEEDRQISMAFANIGELKRKAEFLKLIERKLPDRADSQGFYQALTKILEVTNVSYSELVPKKQEVRSVYTEIPYQVICRARYHDFGQFLNLIEENPDRFMRVKTFTIDNDDARPSVHPTKVDIGTFMFNSKG